LRYNQRILGQIFHPSSAGTLENAKVIVPSSLMLLKRFALDILKLRWESQNAIALRSSTLSEMPASVHESNGQYLYPENKHHYQTFRSLPVFYNNETSAYCVDPKDSVYTRKISVITQLSKAFRALGPTLRFGSGDYAFG
jgi:hypothetical protein